MIHVTCRLTAKNRDQLRNPALGNRIWATFTFFVYICTLCTPRRRSVVKVENLRRGNSVFSVAPKFQRGPQSRQQGLSDADASEYSMPYLPFFFSVYMHVSVCLFLYVSCILCSSFMGQVAWINVMMMMMMTKVSQRQIRTNITQAVHFGHFTQQHH